MSNWLREGKSLVLFSMMCREGAEFASSSSILVRLIFFSALMLEKKP
jgi:hypothetical protein